MKVSSLTVIIPGNITVSQESRGRFRLRFNILDESTCLDLAQRFLATANRLKGAKNVKRSNGQRPTPDSAAS